MLPRSWTVACLAASLNFVLPTAGYCQTVITRESGVPRNLLLPGNSFESIAAYLLKPSKSSLTNGGFTPYSTNGGLSIQSLDSLLAGPLPAAEQPLTPSEVTRIIVDEAPSAPLPSAVTSVPNNWEPKTFADLPNEDTYVYSYVVEGAFSGSVGGASGKASKATRFVFLQYQKYADIRQGTQIKRVGMSISFRVEAAVTDNELKTGGAIPFLAASATYRGQTNKASLSSQGFDSPAFNLARARCPTMVTAENLTEIENVFLLAKQSMWAENATFQPEVLGVFPLESEKTDSRVKESEAVTWALLQIADGKKLVDALKRRSLDGRQIDVVRAIYMNVVGPRSFNEAPSSYLSDSVRRDFLRGVKK